jgi:hypothetical protein
LLVPPDVGLCSTSARISRVLPKQSRGQCSGGAAAVSVARTATCPVNVLGH